MLSIADRLESVGFSNIRKIYEKANQLSAKGHNIYNLILGEPDFSTPRIITESGTSSIYKGETHYTSNYGLLELREAIAQKLQDENNINASASEILITTGATESVFASIIGILNPGDEALIPVPTWPHYEACCNLAGATPIAVPIDFNNGTFSLNPYEIEKRITQRTRLLVLNTPSNPTGMMLDNATMMEISKIAIKHNLIVISDEIYEKLIYDNAHHISIASLPGMYERTITINGFSKAYAMTGWRVGYLHAPENLLNGLVRLHQYNVTCLPAFTQRAATTAILEAQADVELMRKEFNRRRDLIVSILNKSKFLDVKSPKGAFYLFINIKATGKKSDQLVLDLLEKTGVAMVPGTAFGDAGEGYVRISYAAKDEVLINSANKIVSYLDAVLDNEGSKQGALQ
ncbi:pyridoxal phosphate-dependent aminotransferase [Priestia megaterium]|uniref:pyridoxal phosphate-dependent aminotransferase n=1 Tax=Priestia megaterium TaxID=1404 RepID=UPI002452FE45|nr:pyridoxal phosphate-dependent aminotransferase [Priestia megaterium]MDH3183562.1 pyridoxal phosphate-dependent aminotransferase [Priestia megaterium]MDH3183602.1 pyridoxal phosphate-dependent aminotransferase [Priestia megaterium]